MNTGRKITPILPFFNSEILNKNMLYKYAIFIVIVQEMKIR